MNRKRRFRCRIMNDEERSMNDDADNQKITSFTDLHTWQVAHTLVLEIYRITREFPREEQFGLTSQLRRAVVSITSNIAEGFSRPSYKEKIQFYSMSLGSLTEVQNQMIIAKDIEYLQEATFIDIERIIINTHKLLNGLIKSSKSYIA